MMITVANPIYDAVFKYLMEDERVAKTLLSALLKREVEEVEVRKHEYTNCSRDKISMFRIDFGAKVRQDMNVEDEYFSAIENRDTAIMLRDKKIAERDAQLAEQSEQLAEQSEQLAEQSVQLAKIDNMLSTTIKMLLSAGVNIETIAVNMNIAEEEVRSIAERKE